MSTLSNLILIFISILCVFSYKHRQLENDNMCKVKGGILCVKDELLIIATLAKGIARTLDDVENNIKQTKVLETVNRYVNIEMNYTRFNILKLPNHANFFQYNNIDNEYLTDLFVEGHDTMMYYYNSIDHLLNLQDVFAQTTDEWFKRIQYNIKDDIICRYRNILNVYSQKWKTINDIDRIQFSGNYRLSPSLTHDVYSIVIAKYLRESMEQIYNVIMNLESKYV